jgi:hypothetical protein
MVWTVRHLILPLIVERNRPVAVGGSGLKRTPAKAGSEAEEATVWVAMKVSMVSLKRSRQSGDEAEQAHRPSAPRNDAR